MLGPSNHRIVSNDYQNELNSHKTWVKQLKTAADLGARFFAGCAARCGKMCVFMLFFILFFWKMSFSSMLTWRSTTIWDKSPTQIQNLSSICRVRSLVHLHGGSIYATFPEKSPSRTLRRLDRRDPDVLFQNWGDCPNSTKVPKKTSKSSFCNREERFDHHFLPISKSHRPVDGPQKESFFADWKEGNFTYHDVLDLCPRLYKTLDALYSIQNWTNKTKYN